MRNVKVLATSSTSAKENGASKAQDRAEGGQQGKPNPKEDLGAALFGLQSASTPISSKPFSTSSNPFSTGSTLSSTANPFSTSNAFQEDAVAAPPEVDSSSLHAKANASDLPATFAEKAKISQPPQPTSTTPNQVPFVPWSDRNPIQKPYSYHHLDADYEYLDSATQSSNSNITNQASTALAESLNKSEDTSNDDCTIPDNSFDKTFNHFASTLSQNPEQVLRYEYAGKPLLYSRDDQIGRMLEPTRRDQSLNAKVATVGNGVGSGMPRCQNCGAKRVFELQLTPRAIAELEAEDENVVEEGMEWGTIILGVCAENCWGNGARHGQVSRWAGAVNYLEEWVGVQWEEVITRTPASSASSKIGKQA